MSLDRIRALSKDIKKAQTSFRCGPVTQGEVEFIEIRRLTQPPYSHRRQKPTHGFVCDFPLALSFSFRKDSIFVRTTLAIAG